MHEASRDCFYAYEKSRHSIDISENTVYWIEHLVDTPEDHHERNWYEYSTNGECYVENIKGFHTTKR